MTGRAGLDYDFAGVAYLEVNLIQYAVILPFNAEISISATYQLFE